ncbi:S8/S53 family peptidase [Paenibacillus lactis]
MLSKYPSLDANTLRYALTTYGDPLHGYENPAPRINVHKAESAIVAGVKMNDSRTRLPSLNIKDATASLQSRDEMERAVALSTLVRNQLCSRELLWQCLNDPSPVVRKIAVSALEKPLNEQERDIFWERLEKEAEGGVRGLFAYGLLQDVRDNECAKWIPWSTDINWSVRWCVSEYLASFPDSYPQLEMTYDPDSIISTAAPLIQWLKDKRS